MKETRTETRASRAIAEWLEGGSAEEPHTQEVLASRLSARVGRTLSQSTVSHISRGMQQPRADLVGAFRAELGIEPEWWLPDSQQQPPPSATSLAADAADEDEATETGTGG